MMRRVFWLGVAAAIGACFGTGIALADPIATVIASHIDGNVPPPEHFKEFLERDLRKYFTVPGGAPAALEYEMLREEPTQTGISFPKYYVWVKVVDSGGTVQEGAAQVAAIQKARFEVTHFFSKAQIREGPQDLQLVFPPAVCDAAIAKAGKPL
jgi:hypothetical protein